jgi:signal transduction histidine kinase/CheY-like chemotaxis protein
VKVETYDIQEMLAKQLDRGLYSFAVIGFFALIGSLSRAIPLGWHNVMWLHISVYVLFLLFISMKHRLSFKARSCTITGIVLLLGVAGLIAWGLIAFGLIALFSFCLLATILFGTRSGIIATLFSMSIIGAVCTAVQAGIITFSFDADTYLHSVTSWMSAITVIALSAGLFVVALGTLNRQMTALVQSLQTKNEELVEANRLLRIEIQERKRSDAERASLEKKLQNAKKMEAVGTLAGGVAHDLNNVLGGIIGYPEILLHDLPEKSPLRETVIAMKKSGEKAAAIVQDLLTMARRGITTSIICNLRAILDEYLSSPQCQKLKSFHPDIRIEADLSDDLSNIKGSPVHLFKTTMNLVSNAAEAMPSGGKIRITAENRFIDRPIGGYDSVNTGEYVVLAVSDAGKGISAEDMDRIFEPFYSKKVMGRSGTGLGLAVVWGTVKDHNGYIEVRSSEESGTTFILYFPATTEKVLLESLPSSIKKYRGRGESILVVDDVKEQREIAFRLLSILGYSVSVVPSGEEAVEYLRDKKVDLLLLDMIMDPGINGLDTYKRVLELHPHQRAIIASGYTETDLVYEARKLGAGQYLKKPYNLELLGMAASMELSKRLP